MISALPAIYYHTTVTDDGTSQYDCQYVASDNDCSDDEDDSRMYSITDMRIAARPWM